MRTLRLLSIVLTLSALLAMPLPAHATFAGTNGSIAYQTDGFGGPGLCPNIDIVDPTNPSAIKQMTSCPPYVGDPNWSADASKIAVHYLDPSNHDSIGTISTSSGTGAITKVAITGASNLRDPAFNNDAS